MSLFVLTMAKLQLGLTQNDFKRAQNLFQNIEAVCREHKVTATSSYRWKKRYGGMELQEGRRYRELELKKLRADQLLKIRVLEEVKEKMVSPALKQ